MTVPSVSRRGLLGLAINLGRFVSGCHDCAPATPSQISKTASASKANVHLLDFMSPPLCAGWERRAGSVEPPEKEKVGVRLSGESLSLKRLVSSKIVGAAPPKAASDGAFASWAQQELLTRPDVDGRRQPVWLVLHRGDPRPRHRQQPSHRTMSQRRWRWRR